MENVNKVSYEHYLKELCSLPNNFCSFPTEMTKMSLRELTHATVEGEKNTGRGG